MSHESVCNATLVTCVFVVLVFWAGSDARNPETPSSKTSSDHSRSPFQPFPSVHCDCSSEALSWLPHFVNTPVALTHGFTGPLPLYFSGVQCLLLCNPFAFSQKVGSSVCLVTSPREGRHMFCPLLGRRMVPEDCCVPLPYCSERFPCICSQISVWPSSPISVLCSC